MYFGVSRVGEHEKPLRLSSYPLCAFLTLPLLVVPDGVCMYVCGNEVNGWLLRLPLFYSCIFSHSLHKDIFPCVPEEEESTSLSSSWETHERMTWVRGDQNMRQRMDWVRTSHSTTWKRIKLPSYNHYINYSFGHGFLLNVRRDEKRQDKDTHRHLEFGETYDSPEKIQEEREESVDSR